jgi:bacterial/archaeal transporter family-2 protein
MSPTSPALPRLRLLDLAAAFGTGGLLSLMVLYNGTLAFHTTPFFSSLAAHATGTVAALLLLALLPRARSGAALPPAPLWAYLGGLSGAVTVILTGAAMNTVLALTGTLALGLAGQVAFSLAADRWGLFGLPRRRPTARDLGAIALIAAGSLAIIYSGQNPGESGAP